MPPKGERRKQQIINTAKEMFMERGFQSTHIGQVCEKLNIARGTVYQYFSNKKEIVYAILENLQEKIEDILDVEDLNDYFNQQADSKVMLRFLTDRIAGVIGVFVNEPVVIRLVFKEITGVDEEVTKKVDIFLGKIIKAIAREVDGIKKLGLYKPSLNSHITASMLMGGVMMIIYEYEHSGKDLLDNAVIESIAHNYLHGIIAVR